MSTVQEIESAIKALPPQQRWDLLHRFQDRLWDDWDKQIEADSTAGRLDHVLKEVEADIATGRTIPPTAIPRGDV